MQAHFHLPACEARFDRHFSDTVIHWRWSMGKKAVRVHEAVFNSRSLKVSVYTVKQILLTSERNQ